jgi:lipoate-protein ligase A
MEGSSQPQSLSTVGFETAKENMAYDTQLLMHLPDDRPMVRVYLWQTPGITVSFKQTCPAHMAHIDHAIRPTGGGIVYHSPGDVVFALASHNHVPKQKPTHILTMISSKINHALALANVSLDAGPLPGLKDPSFCQTYPTPFELSVNGKKICGLTIRQFKTNWLVQGIIHASPTHQSLHPFVLSDHQITTQFDSLSIQKHLINALSSSII